MKFLIYEMSYGWDQGRIQELVQGEGGLVFSEGAGTEYPFGPKKLKPPPPWLRPYEMRKLPLYLQTLNLK